MKRVLLLGAAGMLGTDLAASAPPTVELLPRTHRDLDVTDETAVGRALRDERPDVVINATAYTDVDGAEKEPEQARQINGVAPGILGRAARDHAIVIHYSTDYIFNAHTKRPLSEDEPSDPLNAYGRSKLEGERALAASGAKYLIIRTQWLFGLHGRSFPRTMWERALKKLETRVVNDQFGRPTYTVDLAQATWRVVERVTTHDSRLTAHDSTLHVANSGVSTWYDIARHVFRAAGAEASLQPCTSAEFPRPARRPGWSVLDTTRYESLTGTPLSPWEDALDRFLLQLKAERLSS